MESDAVKRRGLRVEELRGEFERTAGWTSLNYTERCGRDRGSLQRATHRNQGILCLNVRRCFALTRLDHFELELWILAQFFFFKRIVTDISIYK